jgi:hypothetical protein
MGLVLVLGTGKICGSKSLRTGEYFFPKILERIITSFFNFRVISAILIETDFGTHPHVNINGAVA